MQACENQRWANRKSWNSILLWIPPQAAFASPRNCPTGQHLTIALMMDDTRGGLAHSTLNFFEEKETAKEDDLQQWLTNLESSPRPTMSEPGASSIAPFFLPDVIDLENKALESGTLQDAIKLWSLPYYNQRKYWFKMFIGSITVSSRHSCVTGLWKAFRNLALAIKASHCTSILAKMPV